MSIARKPLWRRQQFWRVTLPVVAALAVVVAALLVYDSIYGSNGSPNAAKGWGVTYPAPAKPKPVKLDPGARAVVRRFVATAVARKDLATAYRLSGPEIRQGMTRAQFEQGQIAVVPFPVDARTTVKVTKIDYSYENRAQLELELGTPGRKVSNSPHTFYANLIKQHGTWFVNSWVPRWTPPIPTDPGR